MRKIALACALLLCFVLTGCEEGECWLCWGDRPNQGRLTLGLTAAPTPRADVLVLAVAAVALLDESNQWQRIDLDPPRPLDLLPAPGQPGGQRVLLLEQERLDGGRYKAIQLIVDAHPASQASYVEIGSAHFPLELAAVAILNASFDMPRSGALELVMDVDVHRGLARLDASAPLPESLALTPHLRLAEIEDSGSIAGTVTPGLRDHASCNLPTGAFSGRVYVFAGRGIDAGNALRGDNLPVASVPVQPIDGSYQAFFLPADDYTLAFACETEDYQPYASDGVELLRFVRATVRAGRVAPADF